MRVLITGSNRGIGLEYVRQLLARGEHVFAMCRNPDSAQELQVLRDQYTSQLVIIKLDVTDPTSVNTAYDEVSAQVDSLDLIINNAGIDLGAETLGNIQKTNFMRAFEVNVVGVMLVSQRFVHLLKCGDNPRLVNIGSGAGSMTEGAPAGLYSYNASKAGLNMLTTMLHRDLQTSGIITIVLNPGWVITDMGGANAKLQPEDSVRQQLQVIDGLTIDDSGVFKNYDGGEIAW